MSPEELESLHCPYCLDPLRVRKVSRQIGGRIDFGLVGCSCFEFPIVYGVLLLQLTKGYGGAEEDLQPLVPMQAAALEYLGAGEPEALERWLRKHVPLLWLLGRGDCSYLDFASKRIAALEPKVSDAWIQAGRYEVLGTGRLRAWSKATDAAGWSVRWPMTTPLGVKLRGRLRGMSPDTLADYYVDRFLSPELFQLETLLGALPTPARALSLCCGHGVSELLARRVYPKAHIVSVDAQLLNLMVVKRFINPAGTFICHDVQMPLPFADGSFGASFSSICLQEIPSRAFFIREKTRVVSAAGWSLFDSCWWEEPRLDPTRWFRFLQNFQGSTLDTYRLVQKCCPEHVVSASRYSDRLDPDWTPSWTSTPAEVNALLEGAPGWQSSLVVARGADLRPRRPEDVPRASGFMVNPRYALEVRGDEMILRLRGRGANGANVLGARRSAKRRPAEVRVARSTRYDEPTLRRLYASGVLLPRLASFSRTAEPW